MAKLQAVKFTLKKSHHEVVIRSYESGDQEAIQQFAKKIARETTHTLKYEAMPDMTRDQLAYQYDGVLKHPVNLTIGAFLNDQLVGNLRFFQRNENHPWVKHMGAFGMAVAQDYWGEGLGSKMLQIITEHAKNEGIVRIEAEVRTANENGVRLYKKNGFKIEGLREKAAFINGNFVDEYYIAKIIT
jgi:RimJ/RimL family protein N-acetyltransferase